MQHKEKKVTHLGGNPMEAAAKKTKEMRFVTQQKKKSSLGRLENILWKPDKQAAAYHSGQNSQI